jgi:hypothetical protein
VPPSAATGPERDSQERKDKDEDDSSGLFGPFRIGVLVGTGLPSVLSFGAAIKLTRFLGAGLNVGLIPAVTISIYGEAELSYQEYDVYGRIFPFGGAFFVGAGVGYATIEGTFTNSYDVSAFPSLPNPLLVKSQGSVRTLVLTPAIGVQHTFKPGFTLGADAGLQIPIAPSEVEFNTIVPASVPPQVEQQYVDPNDQQVRDTLDTIGRAIVPTVNLRIGWLL